MSKLIENTEIQIFARLYASPKVYFEHASKLSDKIFTNGKIKMFYRAFETLIKENKKTDSYSICKQLNRIDLVNEVVEMVQKVNFDNSVESLIDYLFEENKRSGLKDLIIELNTKLNSGEEIETIIAHAQKSIIEISDVKANSIKHIAEYLKEMMDNIDRNQSCKGLTGIATGIKDFDQFTGGLQKSDLVIIGGATSQGKTSLAMTFLNHIVKNNIPAAMFSLEMSSLQLATRLSAQESEIDSKHLLRGKLTVQEMGILNSKISRISCAPLYINESSTTTLHGIVNSIHAMVMQLGVEVVVIDYLQLISNHIKGRTKESEVAEIARTLKNLAKELNINIILLSQLSRSQNASDSRPSMKNLRDSGQIEEAADIVVLVYRPEGYYIETDESGNSTKGKAELIIAKGRNTGTASIDALYDNHLTRFRGLETQNYFDAFPALQPSKQFDNEPF
jgi:replicative DNA helicase